MLLYLKYIVYVAKYVIKKVKINIQITSHHVYIIPVMITVYYYYTNMHAGTTTTILKCIQVRYGKYTYLCIILYYYYTSMHTGTVW